MAPVASRPAADGSQIENTFQQFLERYGLSEAAVGNILNIDGHAQSIARILDGLVQAEEQRNGPLAMPKPVQLKNSKTTPTFRLTGTKITSEDVDAPHSWIYGGSELEYRKTMSFVAEITLRTSRLEEFDGCMFMNFCHNDPSGTCFFIDKSSKFSGYTSSHDSTHLVYIKDLVPKIKDGKKILLLTKKSSIKFIEKDWTSFGDITRFNTRLNSEWSGHPRDNLLSEDFGDKYLCDDDMEEMYDSDGTITDPMMFD